MVAFSNRPFPTFLNTETYDETLQQSGKQDSFRHYLKSLASMYESSDSQASLEPPLEYNQDQTSLMNQGSSWPFEPSWELQKGK